MIPLSADALVKTGRKNRKDLLQLPAKREGYSEPAVQLTVPFDRFHRRTVDPSMKTRRPSVDSRGHASLSVRKDAPGQLPRNHLQGKKSTTASFSKRTCDPHTIKIEFSQSFELKCRSIHGKRIQCSVRIATSLAARWAVS